MMTTKELLLRLKQLAGNAEAENKKFLKDLKRKSSSEIDDIFQTLHDEVFEQINCLDCANCCSSISPIITDRDIGKISRALKTKPSEVVVKYLQIDEDNDYVFRNQPCPFLCGDNYCSIYEDRPKACREYPHTDRKKIQQLFTITLKNSKICPAVYLILEKIKTHR